MRATMLPGAQGLGIASSIYGTRSILRLGCAVLASAKDDFLLSYVNFIFGTDVYQCLFFKSTGIELMTN